MRPEVSFERVHRRYGRIQIQGAQAAQCFQAVGAMLAARVDVPMRFGRVHFGVVLFVRLRHLQRLQPAADHLVSCAASMRRFLLIPPAEDASNSAPSL